MGHSSLVPEPFRLVFWLFISLFFLNKIKTRIEGIMVLPFFFLLFIDLEPLQRFLHVVLCLKIMLLYKIVR